MKVFTMKNAIWAISGNLPKIETGIVDYMRQKLDSMKQEIGYNVVMTRKVTERYELQNLPCSNASVGLAKRAVVALREVSQS